MAKTSKKLGNQPQHPVNSPLVDRWLSVKDAAEYTGYSAVSLYRFAHSGQLESVRAPGTKRSLRFRIEWLDTFMCGGDQSKVTRIRQQTPMTVVPQRIREQSPEFAEKLAKTIARRQAQAAKQSV
jgi:excisionase family DNA binding protein